MELLRQSASFMASLFFMSNEFYHLDGRVLRVESRLAELESFYRSPISAFDKDTQIYELRIAFLEKTLDLERLQYSLERESLKKQI